MISAVLAAGRYLMSVKPQPIVSAKDFLTQADIKSEEIIRAIMESFCSDISFSGEEGSGQLQLSRYQWSVDPLDGTVNYWNGDSHWGVSVALVKDGKSRKGVVYLPKQKKIFFTDKKNEVWEARVLLGRVVKIKRLYSPKLKKSKSLVLVEWVKEQNDGQDHKKVLDLLGRIDQAGFLYPQIRNASTASLMMVVTGVAGGFVHLRPESWDIAAAGLIAQRAGCQVTDLSGNPWSPFVGEKGLLVTNGQIDHRLLLTATKP